MILTEDELRELMKNDPPMTEEQLIAAIGKFDSVDDMAKHIQKVNLLRETADKVKGV